MRNKIDKQIGTPVANKPFAFMGAEVKTQTFALRKT